VSRGPDDRTAPPAATPHAVAAGVPAHSSRSLQEVGLAIKRVQARHHRALDTALLRIGISLVQWDAMRHLAANPGASLHDLAQLTFQTDQAFGTLAGRMVDRGLIARLSGPGRAVRHEMTAKGHKLLDEGSVLVDRVLVETRGVLGPRQLDALGGLLEQILSAPPPGEGR